MIIYLILLHWLVAEIVDNLDAFFWKFVKYYFLCKERKRWMLGMALAKDSFLPVTLVFYYKILKIWTISAFFCFDLKFIFLEIPSFFFHFSHFAFLFHLFHLSFVMWADHQMRRTRFEWLCKNNKLLRDLPFLLSVWLINNLFIH